MKTSRRQFPRTATVSAAVVAAPVTVHGQSATCPADVTKAEPVTIA